MPLCCSKQDVWMEAEKWAINAIDTGKADNMNVSDTEIAGDDQAEEPLILQKFDPFKS